jgi:hypothetical protein
MKRGKLKLQASTVQKDSKGVDCFICQRGGTHLKYLGNDRYRHESCAPGSPNWKDWYDSHPEEHTDAGDILRGK